MKILLLLVLFCANCCIASSDEYALFIDDKFVSSIGDDRVIIALSPGMHRAKVLGGFQTFKQSFNVTGDSLHVKMKFYFKEQHLYIEAAE